MSIEHLSDKRIQEHLDNKSRSGRLSPGEQRHLESCELCRGAMADYGHLYSGLAQEERRLLSSDFTARTMARIRSLEKPAAAMSRSMLFLVVIGIVTVCSVVNYFVNIKSILYAIESFSVGRLTSSTTIVSAMEQWSAKLGGNLDILVFAGLLLILVGLVDKLLVKQKASRAYFLSV